MSEKELILFAAYVVMGPLAVAFVGLMMFAGRKRMRRLYDWKAALPPDPPAVTVLIPAKDEGDRVRACVESVLAQDYPNFSVVTIDDRSTDDTGRILDEVAAASNGRVRSLHVPQGGLPAGWLGKCHALHIAAKHATGSPWLLFIDSDVKLKRPDAFSTTVAVAQARDYDALSILTAIECETFLERLVLPLAAGTWSVMNTVSYTNNDNRPEHAYANGQFFLIRRSAYDAAGGHEFVKDQITEDVELARRMKSQGATVRLLFGAKFASTRMHATLSQMFRGWARIYSGTTRRRPGRLIAVALFILICCFSAYAALAWGVAGLLPGHAMHRPWLIASIVHLVAISLALGLVYAARATRAATRCFSR